MRSLLYAMNPSKIQVCQMLIREHVSKGHKILVFSDQLYALEQYAAAMNYEHLSGKHGSAVRDELLEAFRTSDQCNVLFLSKIGDYGIDLPDANVIIQINSHGRSRRQEAQRLGRILRPKPRVGQEYNAWFYTLVSNDTLEVSYSMRRQSFLVHQGFAYRVDADLCAAVDSQTALYTTTDDHAMLLHRLTQAAACDPDGLDLLDDEAAVGGGSGGGRGGGSGSRGSANRSTSQTPPLGQAAVAAAHDDGAPRPAKRSKTSTNNPYLRPELNREHNRK
jgi:DNA excision repair protein ERCC-3